MIRIRVFFSLILLFTVTFSLCACTGSSLGLGSAPAEETGENGEKTTEASAEVGEPLTPENAVGRGWQCTYKNSADDTEYRRFVLAADKSYEAIVAINGLFSHKDKGTYEVKGGALYLYLNGDPSASTVYEYENGNLINNGNEFLPYEE